jgi:hypothetical protein
MHGETTKIIDLNVFQKRRKCGLTTKEEAEWWKDYYRKLHNLHPWTNIIFLII